MPQPTKACWKRFRAVRQNVMSFQLGVLNSDAVLRIVGNYELGLRYCPMHGSASWFQEAQPLTHPRCS